MAKSRYEALSEKILIGRETPQIPAQEDTLQKILAVLKITQLNINPENSITILLYGQTPITLYDVSYDYEYYENGDLKYEYIKGKDSDGNMRRFRREFIYDNNGNLITITPWQEV